MKHNMKITHNTVQGFNFWLDGFWKVVGGMFRERDRIKIEQHTFTEVGFHCLTPPSECKVKKTWFSINKPGNRGSVSWEGGDLVIKVDVKEAPCTVKWFNIY